MTINDVFTFHVPGQAGLTRAQQAILKRAVDAGLVDNRSVQEGCRMATDAADAARKITINGKVFHLNANGRARFGKDHTDNPFLTLSLIEDETDLRYKFKWSGNAIPKRMIKVAVDHDLGKTVKATDFELNFADAEVTISEYVPGERAKRPKRDRNGVPPKPRKFGRCRTDDIIKRAMG